MKIKKLLVLLVLVSLGISGCNNFKSIKQGEDNEIIQGMQLPGEDVSKESKRITEYYLKIYNQAVNDGTLGNLDTVKKIVKCLGDAGYTVVDCKNEVDMVNPDKVVEFVGHIEKKEDAELTILCVMDNGGFIRYDFETAEGNLEVVQSTLSWNGNMPEVNNKTEYPAYTWAYSENGYLFFEQYHMPGICLGHTAIRVQALDETCRELNRKYIQPIGYSINNMFISDWSEADYQNLNFYDLYDIMYLMKYERYVPYESTNDGVIYEIPKNEFEDVLMTYFSIEDQALQEKTTYHKESSTYEYRPRGFYDCGPGMEMPYPEVISYEDNQDGTITLTVNAVWREEKLARAFSHEVVIRPLADGGFQYVSNHIIPSDDNVVPRWYTDRLTNEEWKEYYGGME